MTPHSSGSKVPWLFFLLMQSSDVTLNWMVDFVTNKIPESQKVVVDQIT